MNFDQAFERLLGHEGGYVNNPADPGGETNFGVSKRSYPAEDIKGMTLARAKAIYRRDFWEQSGCDTLPKRIRFLMFDAGVNSGPKVAIKLLQRAVGEVEDGILGPKTLKAAQSHPAAALVAKLSAHRLLFLTALPTWPTFGKGWARRVADNLLEST